MLQHITWQLDQLHDYAEFVANNLSVYFAFILTANLACTLVPFRGPSWLLPILCIVGDGFVGLYHKIYVVPIFAKLKARSTELLKAEDFQGTGIATTFDFDQWESIANMFTWAYFLLAAAWLAFLVVQFVNCRTPNP